MLEGQCLCGDITYTLTSNLHYLYRCHCHCHCHCVECRRFSGASHATNAFVTAADLEIKDPQESLASYALESGNRYFCSNCRSPLYSEASGAGKLASLHCGSLSNTPDKTLDANFWTSEKCPWTELAAGASIFEHAPDFD
jgi:hypothetical protein